MTICHVCNMANDGFASTSALRKIGVDAELIIDSNDFGMGLPQWEIGTISGDPYKPFNLEEAPPLPDWIHVWENASFNKFCGVVELYRMVKKYDMIHLHSPASAWLRHTKTPYMVYDAGFIRLLSDGTNWTKLGVESYQKAMCVTWTNTDTGQMIKNLNPKKMSFIPFAIDTERYIPGKPDQDLWWFMPSRQVWDVKGNDLMLHAYLKYCAAGGNARLTLVDWGYDEDVKAATQLLKPVAEKVTWILPQTKPNLIQLYQRASAVFDQFHLGASGTVGFEAMSCGTPLCIYLAESATECFGETLPCANASTIDEIESAMWMLENKKYRTTLGVRERRFAKKHLSYAVIAKRLKEIYGESGYDC